MSARCQIPFSFGFPGTISATAVQEPASGITVTVTNRVSLTPATVYSTETGSGTLSSITTDSFGNVPTAWVAEGSYTVAGIASGSFTGASIGWEAAYGAGVGNVAANAIGTAQIADGSVTSSKLAASAVNTAALGANAVTAAKMAAAAVGYTTTIPGALLGINSVMGSEPYQIQWAQNHPGVLSAGSYFQSITLPAAWPTSQVFFGAFIQNVNATNGAYITFAGSVDRFSSQVGYVLTAPGNTYINWFSIGF